MKRIATFITIVNAIIFAIVLSAVSVIATLRAAAIIEEDASALLIERLDTWSMRIDGLFNERLAYIKSFKSRVWSALDLKTLADDKKIAAYFDQLKIASANVLKNEGLLNLYLRARARVREGGDPGILVPQHEARRDRRLRTGPPSPSPTSGRASTTGSYR